MVVAAIAAMINSVFAGSMSVPLQETKLTNQRLVIWHAYETARPERQGFQINLALWDVGRLITHAAMAPGRLDPFSPIAVANDRADAILPAEGSEFLRDRLRIERRPGATNDSDDVALALLVAEGNGVVVVTPA